MRVFEVKTVLSNDKIAYFPDDNSKRLIKQLNYFLDMLKSGYEINFCIYVLISSEIERIKSNNKFEIKSRFIKAIHLGMRVETFRSVWNSKSKKFYTIYDKKATELFIFNKVLVHT